MREQQGCPVMVWDGPYSFRCGKGAEGGVCATHGRFREATVPEQRPLDELVTVALTRREWMVVVRAAADYNVRVPREQGDGGACLDKICEAIGGDRA